MQNFVGVFVFERVCAFFLEGGGNSLFVCVVMRKVRFAEGEGIGGH